MKAGVIMLIIMNVILFSFGVYFLATGRYFSGVFNILLNFIFFFVNLKTLKFINEN